MQRLCVAICSIKKIQCITVEAVDVLLKKVFLDFKDRQESHNRNTKVVEPSSQRNKEALGWKI